MARRAYPLALLALVPLLALWPAIFGGMALGPHDQVGHFSPWNRTGPMGAWDILPMDGVLQFHVWRDLVFASWKAGEVPFWNPYSLCGTPLLANSQSGALYPFHVLLGVLGLPTALSMALLAWMHLGLAGGGVFALARRLGASEPAALAGGMSFALSPFLLGWTALASVPSTVTWIPWMLWSIVGVVREERPLRSMAWLGLFFGLAALAGHLQFLAYAGVAAASFALILGFSEKRGLRVLAACGGLALGVGLAAPHLVPVLDYGQFSHRRGAPPNEEGYQAYSSSAIRTWELGALVNPTGLGDPRVRITEEKPELPPFGAYWPAYSKLGANWAESAISPGPLASLALCFLPFIWRKLREAGAESGAMALGGVGLVGLLMAMGTPLNRLLYFGVPGWSSTGSPGRASVLFVLAACCLLALVADRLTRSDLPDRSFRLGLVVFAVVGFGTLALGARPQPAIQGFEEVMKLAVATATTIALPMSFLLILLVAQAPILARAPFAAKVQPYLWPGIVLASAALWGAFHIVPMGHGLEAKAPEGVGPHERVAMVNKDWSLFGPVPGVQYPPNTLALARVREVGGYDSLLHRDTKALLDELNGQDSAPPANGNMMLVKPSADAAKLQEAGASQIVGTLDQPGDFQPTGRVQRDKGTATIEAETMNTITIKTSGPAAGKLTLKDRAMPGWTVNGAPVAVGKWIEVEVPAGDATVNLRYEAPGFKTGLMIGVLSLIGLVGLAVLGRPKPPVT